MSFLKLFIVIFFLIICVVNGQTKIRENKKTDIPEDSVFIMKKSPTGALLRSAVLPGWGQFYNESYWKIPIIWGASGWFIYMWNNGNNLYKKYQTLYHQSLNGIPNDNYKSLRNIYRDNRDQFAIYLGITYLLNIIDAYVDAHMFDFDVGINNITQKPQLLIKFRL